MSDSHGWDDNMDEIIEQEKPMDVFIHLGDLEGSESRIPDLVNPDCKIYLLKGNNDFYSEELPSEMEIELCGHHIYLTHGHTHGVNYDMEPLVDEAKARGCDIAMFGHTHKPYFDTIEGVTLINPGSISYPRQKGRKPSYMIMEMNDDGRYNCREHYLDSKATGFF